MDVKTQTDGVDANSDEVSEVAPASTAQLDQQPESIGSFLLFLAKLLLAVLIFRSFIFSPFSIPSESMLPRLWNGDYLLAAKWPYGFTRNSLPLSAPLIPGRVFASSPEPGDIVIFKHPIDGSDYIKRAIALPGDSVGMIGGQIVLNGELVPKERIEDFVIPMSGNTGCAWGGEQQTSTAGEDICAYRRFRETLPNGVSYEVLDFGLMQSDNVQPIIVPEGQMFVMGDNRDNSQDSRFPAMSGGGVGLVPQDNLVGRATIIMWSTDGGSDWFLPWTWFTAARWGRMGETL